MFRPDGVRLKLDREGGWDRSLSDKGKVRVTIVESDPAQLMCGQAWFRSKRNSLIHFDWEKGRRE